jgi:oligopeptide transport system substrate-binding protein
MVLSRNPNFHGQTYPCEGEAGDREAGLLDDCGKPLPFIDQAVFTREKEAIPYWNKFLQGYFDASGFPRTALIRRCASMWVVMWR